MSRVRFADGSQGPKVQDSRAQSFLVPSALLPEDGDDEVAEAAVVPMRAQPHLANGPVEVDAGHVLPRLVAGRRALESGDEPAEPLLVVRGLHPSGVLSCDEEEGEAGRRLHAPHVDRLLADVRVELDPPPTQDVGLEGIAAIEEAELVGVGGQTIPTPVALLTVLDPLPRELEGLLEAPEGHVEHHDRLGVVRVEVGCLLRALPLELRDVDALLGAPGLEVLVDVCGGVVDPVDELELRGIGQESDPALHERVVGEEPLHHGEGTAHAEEATEELTGLLEGKTGHDDLPPYAHSD